MKLSAANVHHCRRETTIIPKGPIKICEPHRSVPFEVSCKKFLKFIFPLLSLQLMGLKIFKRGLIKSGTQILRHITAVSISSCIGSL